MSDAPRKLATIVALDVAGYSARTEEDEAKSTAEVAGLRGVIEAIAKTHAGRIFNTAGDGFMLEFASSLAAVEAACELAERCEPKVRVGVHLGDVVVQPNGDLLGHGVNVAARLMARSEPGSALISADVRRTIRGPFAERLVSRGQLRLDKMAETIEAFALAAVASTIVATQPKSAEPLLVVLPFDNLSNDPEMQFFSDGVSEDVIYSLVQGAGLDVIGRTSAFQFRGERKAEAARILKATHVLDGSVRRSGSHIRVTAQLLEANTGRGLWAERYDRDLSDILALQDEIATHVTVALRGVLPRPRPPVPKIDPAAYELALRAVRLYSDITYQEAHDAEALFQQCVSLAPNYARAWAGLAIARVSLLSRDADAMPEALHAATLAAANRALSLDPNCAQAYQALTGLQPAFSKYAEKDRLLEKAVALAPGEPWILTTDAGHLVSVGHVRDASAQLARAETLDPMAPFIAGARAGTLCSIGCVEEGLARFEDARRRLPESALLWLMHLGTFVAIGRMAQAEAMCAPGAAIPSAVPLAAIERTRFRISLPTLPKDQRESFMSSLLDPARDGVLRLEFCATAAQVGCTDLAYDRLFAALDSGRAIGTAFPTLGIIRSNLSMMLFNFGAIPLRNDKRFPRLCARLGFVDYWRTSGHWPDCATEVSYNFKAECEQAAREVAKA